MTCTPFPFNATRPIPNPAIKPCPWPTLHEHSYVQIDPTGLPANMPNPNPGTPNPQYNQPDYHGFPQVPVDSFVP